MIALDINVHYLEYQEIWPTVICFIFIVKQFSLILLKLCEIFFMKIFIHKFFLTQYILLMNSCLWLSVATSVLANFFQLFQG